jgi:hypothetical protein
MVSTAVLLTVVLSAFTLVGGAFYALVFSLGHRIDDFGARFDRLEGRFDRLESEMAGIKAAVAVLESRLEH